MDDLRSQTLRLHINIYIDFVMKHILFSVF